MIRTPSTLEIVWGIYLLLVVIILFRPIVPILGESQFPMPLFVQSEPIYPPLCAIAWASVCTRRSQRLVSPLLLAHNPSGVARSAIAHAYIHAPHPHHARAQRSCVASIQLARCTYMPQGSHTHILTYVCMSTEDNGVRTSVMSSLTSFSKQSW